MQRGATCRPIHTARVVLVLLCVLVDNSHAISGSSYYNGRYTDLSYVTADDSNGLWDSDKQYKQDAVSNDGVWTGCNYDKDNANATECAGPNVVLQNIGISVIWRGVILSSVRTITITDCPNFQYFDEGALEDAVSLTSIIVQRTVLNSMPNLSSATKVQTINLADNRIRIDTNTHRGWTMPSTLQYLAMMDNQIYWIPDQMISSPVLRMASFSNNQLLQIHPSIFGDTSSLVYLGMDGNKISRLSSNSIAPLATNTFIHLNLSNNELSFIQPQTFSQLPALKILEVHNNHLSTITWDTFSHMPNLLHLDLHGNRIQALPTKSFENLPALLELRLHSQDPPMTSIAYDAWSNIGASLRELFVSSNELATFPHQVLQEESYPNLNKIHADNNRITNSTEYGTEAFPSNQYFLHAQKQRTFTPFTTYPGLTILYLHSNRITYVTSTDFCGMPNLKELYLGYNTIRESTMDNNAFQCLGSLTYLHLHSNRIQYVPEALKTTAVLPAIVTIVLTSNKITFLKSDAFSGLSTVQYLYLAWNRILAIEDGAFPSQIRQILFRGNDFRFLHQNPFNGLASLTKLVLAENDIIYIPETAFQGCTSLNYLDLSSNQIPQILKVHLKDCPLGSRLYLDNNDIGWIEDGSLAHITSIYDLYLDNNKMTTLPNGGDFADLTVRNNLQLNNNRINILPTDGFKTLSVTETLSLADNMITELQSYAFNGVSVKFMSLTGNPVRTLNPYSLSSVSVSETLSMNNLDFVHVPEKAFHTVSADKIELMNGQISTFDKGAFYSVTAADMYLQNNAISVLSVQLFEGSSTISGNIYFSNNNMTGIAIDALNGVGLSYVHMDSNLLTTYPQVLKNKQPYGVNLNDNLISQIPTGSLANQTKLEEFYITGNQLTILEPGMMDDLTVLRKLYMTNNQIQTLPEHFLDNLVSLVELDLSNNEMTHFHTMATHNAMTTINLANNQIATLGLEAFTNMAVLNSLNLAGNPLECTCQSVSTLHVVSSAVVSGTCSQPAVTNGVTFAFSSVDATNYYAESKTVPASGFQCSAQNVKGTAVSGTEISIDWEQPDFLYFQANSTLGPSPPLTGSVTYDLTCSSNTAASLTATETDTNSTDSPVTFNKTFTAADGVVAGTTYQCTLTMTTSNYTSGQSEAAVITTPDAAGPAVTPGANDIQLIIKYYDFSKDHVDFNNLQYISISNPTYVASPYGAWLSSLTTPTADTFSEWYRPTTDNHEINTTLLLEHQSGTTLKYWSDEFFPVDGQGFQAEFQLDCAEKYHNFGFTSAVRTGIVYGGSGTITVAGGEALWLYIHRTRMFEFVSVGSATIPCYVIDLSPAATDGVAYVRTGTLSSGTCGSLGTASNVSVELEIGTTYHFDLFHAESKRCTSEFLLEVTDITFSLAVDEDLPIDYTRTLAEDEDVGAIISTVTVEDLFSVGGYTIELYAGNEARRFTVEDGGYTFTPPAAVAPSYTSIIDLDGNTVNYVECATVANISMSNDTAAETFSVTASTAQVTISDVLDYEQAKYYYLLMKVVDATPRTGYIAVRVIVTDANDNCPIISPTSVTQLPQPVLVVAPLATFNSSDIDSGENANIRYVVEQATADPPVDTFNDTMDLWGDVYLRYTSLFFKVVAIDNGTIPRGASADLNITVSNTCVMDVLFGPITYVFAVNDTTGELTLRIPKYWMFEFKCNDDLGMTRGMILDNMISASSTKDPYSTGPGRARVGHPENLVSELAGAWVAGQSDTNQYVEVDMGNTYWFTQVHIQGRDDDDQWVTSYKIQYYNDSTGTWDTYMDSNGTDTFTGNTDRSTIVIQDLDPRILGNKIRVNPQTWSGSDIAMRLEFTGCQQAEQLFYDVSCMRCETSYYCEGEGIQKTCGRCVDTNVTCDRDPTEHSFGVTSECVPCPAGWKCHNGYASPCDKYYYVECTNTSCPLTCTHCEPGYACLDGRRSICEPGSYSDGNMEHCASCESGTYQDLSGQSTCKNCPAGHFSGQRMPQCNQCEPEEYATNDGTGCKVCADATECPCLTDGTCYSASLCYNMGSGTSSCNPCGDGLQGDGTTCTDIDECTLYDPCFQSRCINTEPGYQCLECPDGYSGSNEDAYAWDVHRRVFVFCNQARSNFTEQTCDDIDECATNHGGCDPLMPCVNTIGSYYCDFCARGYIGTNRTGCYLDNFCISGAHDCASYSNCIYLGPAQYRCVCKPGYAGTGDLCGLDSDNDGLPDVGLSCTDWACTRDNCVSVSNSNQDDKDNDNSGDNCDADDDNDGRYDYKDNCQFAANFVQTDSDGDGFGDACDVCVGVSDPDQTDTDGDGVGDACDSDDDDDGIADSSDNCPLVANPGQENSDSDSHGDACDNCPNTSNENQLDSNHNLYGDSCDTPGGTNLDEDGDSILDAFDNCPSYMNGDQSDIDGDGTGDLCDSDIDGDAIPNESDNCKYLSNADQMDVDGNGVGDICETDSDGDGIADKNDTCPNIPAISATSFRNYFTVDLYPGLSTTTSPIWWVKRNGAEVMQTQSTDMPTMLIGAQPYSAVEYQGTWFSTDSTADYYFGLVFGYVSSRKFYVVMWKGQHYNYLEESASTYKGGIQGPQLKLVDSTTGPSNALTQALWHSGDTTNQVKILWQDPAMTAWQPQKSYRWYVVHRPSTGYISLKFYQGTSLVVDSGALYDSTITGGRLGVLQFGPFPMIWANLRAECQDHTNQALYLDGVDDYVTLNDIPALKMEKSFTIEAWVSLDAGFTTGPYPIMCSADSHICLSIEAGQVKGRYGNYNVTSSGTLNAGLWYNVILRHSFELQTIAIFINGVQDGETTDVIIQDWASLTGTSDLTMYIGRENTTYFRGSLDEVRLYSVAILDSEITAHIGLVEVQVPIWHAYGTLHFRMEDSVDTTTLANSGMLTSHTATLSGGKFVESYQQYQQFAIQYPNNR